ncbi:MAG: HypC/HybG/HupF family hydrogenase formation chaperone [Nodosilinea sp.]
MCLGVPGQIQAISDATRHLAIVDIGGVQRPVNISCIMDADQAVEQYVGAWVLVHVGFALNRLDPEEAAATLALLEQLDLISSPAN